jgi:hypothetical protein
LAIEKLEVVSVNDNIDVGEGMETQDVPLAGASFTIKDMFQKTRAKVGDTVFFSYSALGNNNCQNFIKLLLESEGLYREPEAQFVFQDLSQLVKELPQTTTAISQGITHLGALANKYFGVGGAKNEVVIPKEDFVKEHKHLIGLLSSSDDPKLKKEAESQAKELKSEGGKKPCWKGYEQFGSKDKDGKSVPNCVPVGSGKVNLTALYKMSGSGSMDCEGGNQKAGFIRAMMARDEASPEEKREYVSAKTGQTNAEKFEGLDRRGFKLQEMTKTTHDLARKKKTLTRNQAIKRFYDYVIANAPQHQPTSSVNPKRNYREAYDLEGMFDRWREEQGVEIREQRRQRREAPQEVVSPVFPEPPRRRPQVAVPEVVPDPPHSDTVFTFLRDNGMAELKRRLRGKTAQELITFYRRQGGKTRENLRDIATAVGATHRRPPDARGPGAITSEGVAQNIVEKVAN